MGDEKTRRTGAELLDQAVERLDHLEPQLEHHRAGRRHSRLAGSRFDDFGLDRFRLTVHGRRCRLETGVLWPAFSTGVVSTGSPGDSISWVAFPPVTRFRQGRFGRWFRIGSSCGVSASGAAAEGNEPSIVGQPLNTIKPGSAVAVEDPAQEGGGGRFRDLLKQFSNREDGVFPVSEAATNPTPIFWRMETFAVTRRRIDCARRRRVGRSSPAWTNSDLGRRRFNHVNRSLAFDVVSTSPPAFSPGSVHGPSRTCVDSIRRCR